MEQGMSKVSEFSKTIQDGYQFKGDSIILGGAMLDGECQGEHFVRIPLKTLNRHGLISGATGTGKTKTLQIVAEQLSHKGIPSLLMDIKGDLSGIAARAQANQRILERHELIGLPFIPSSSPVEFLTLSDEPGARLRATVAEFGPVLFSKILDLNATQQGIVALIFKYCDDNRLPLVDLDDFKKVMTYLTTDGKEAIEREYGRVSTASVGAIMRKIIELEQQDAEMLFGEPSFDVDDLMRTDKEGRGVVSIVRLTDIQDRPKTFSTFMLQILAEIYASFPEVGDPDQPKLILFFDEAHLLFKEASDALLDQMETVIKLIRSKGVGVVFCTQNPTDIPDIVLSQLGLKLQHSLRAFTAKDRKAIKLAAENYPLTPYYKVDQLLTEMGIGEALVSALDEKGRPTPLVHTLLRAPESRMDILSQSEIQMIIDRSELVEKYQDRLDPESAHELLEKKIDKASTKEVQQDRKRDWERYRRTSRRREKSPLEQVLESTTTRQIGRTIARELTRGLMGILSGKYRK